MFACPISDDAKSDHAVIGDANQIPPFAKVPFFPFEITK